MRTQFPAVELNGLYIGDTIHHPRAGKGILVNGEWEHPGFAKITMITHTKNGSTIVRTDRDQQNLKFAPGAEVDIEVAD